MTSHDNRSTSKASAVPTRTKPDMTAAAFLLTRQVVCYGTGSIRRGYATRHQANEYPALIVTRLSSDGPGETQKPPSGSERVFPISGDLATRNTCNNDQLNPLQASGMTGIPKGSFTFDIGSSGRYRGRRWHRVLAHRVSRIA